VDYPKSRRPYMMRDGSTQSVKVKVHPDRRVQAVVEQIREAEMLQAIDRLRLIHSPRKKTVVILCNIPLDIPVDELVTWRQLARDGRKNRLNPSISLIRLWAVFVEYKPKWQRRWCTALVRHGADPRIALAAVLGVTAGDIQIREAASSEPPARAGTVPKVRPSLTDNPNPA